MSTVTRNLTAAIVGANNKHSHVRISLDYDPAEPYAVTMIFPRADGNHIRWAFARDLLTEGLDGFAGLGDVSVWPGEQRLWIRLSSPDGTCLLALPKPLVAKFVAATERQVRPGTERVDVDGWIAQLLGERA